MFVDLLDCLFYGAAEVAAADTVLDGNIAPIAFAIDFRCTIGQFDFAELRQRHAFAGRRE